MSANFLGRYFESVKKYLVQKIRTRQSALYILLENLPGTPEYIRVLVHARPKNEICRTLQQYPVGENYSNINNIMRAEESCRDASALQQKKAV